MDIYSLLPLLEGWSWVPREEDLSHRPRAVFPGETYPVAPIVVRKGWVIGGSLWIDNPYIFMILEYDDARIDASPYTLNLFGATRPQNIGAWVARYDTTVTPNIFTLVLTPAYPMPFRKKLQVYLENPKIRPDGTPNTAANIYHYNLASVEIVDEGAFIESLKRLFPEVKLPEVRPPVDVLC